MGGEHEHCITFTELKCKDVINICDGARLGRVCDIEMDLCDCQGHVTAIIIPGPCKLFGILRSDEELVISYHCITKIGDDVILVDIPAKT